MAPSAGYRLHIRIVDWDCVLSCSNACSAVGEAYRPKRTSMYARFILCGRGGLDDEVTLKAIYNHT